MNNKFWTKWQLWPKNVIAQILQSLYNFISILANVHGAEKKFKCDRCHKTFAQRCHLRVHISTVHEGQKKYKCEECGKAYTEPRNLKIHIESKHQGVKKCQCDKCDYR